MSSDRFLDDLAADLAPVRPRRPRRDMLLLAAVGAVELALFLLFGAARHDIMLAMKLPSFWWKLGSLGALTIVGAVTAIRSLDPAVSPRRGLRLFAVTAGVAVAIGWVIDASGGGGAALAARLMWRHGIDCVFAMVVLSVPAIVALGLLMRRGAPTDRRGSALAAGATSAAWGAFVFVFKCPHDDPFYIAVWYVVGCAIVMVAGRLLLPLVTRW